MKTRLDFTAKLEELGLTGHWIELGVGAGGFHRHLATGNFKSLWGIDKWNDHHDMMECKKCVEGIRESFILRASFSESVSLFDDQYFDFIYIDGYAHTGQDGGKTLGDWYPKLKKNGIFAGHDYHRRWAPTIKSVDRFLKTIGKFKDFQITKEKGKWVWPSWWIVKS